MSFLDKIAAALTPPESDEDRAEARRTLTRHATGREWVTLAVDQHRQIESAFEQARVAVPDARPGAVRHLGAVLTAHSIAEEGVLYPALVEAGHKGHATMAYEEQAMAKVQLAMLEKLDPASQEWTDKLEHIRGAVLHHIYQEEKDWFVEISDDAPASTDAMLGERFREEYDRYMTGVQQQQGRTALV